MKTIMTTCIIGLSMVATVQAETQQKAAQTEVTQAITTTEQAPVTAQVVCPDYLNFAAKKLHTGESINLCELTQGKPVLIVNTASHCGFTKQFSGLEALNQDYQQQGLVVIGFPSDDFNQEAKDQAETAEVCYRNYGVSFTMLEPMPVRGEDANSVFQYLADKTTAPKWNFYKYLVSGNGETVLQFNSFTKPDSAEFKQAIESIL